MILCLLLTTISCIHLPWANDPVVDLKKDITTAQSHATNGKKQLDEATTTIENSANSIKDSGSKINKKNPKEIIETVKTDLENINMQTDRILGSTKSLSGVSETLDDISKNLKAAESDTEKAVGANSELAQKLKQLEDDKQTALRKAMNYLIAIAILLIAISVVAVFQGNYKAIGGIIGGVIVVIISLAVSVLYMKLAWIGLIGLIGVVIIVIFGIYQGLENKKEKEKAKQEAISNEKALKETVLTVEALKEKLPEDTKKEFFGDKAYPGRVKHLQTPQTEEKILDIRKQLKDMIEPTIVR